LLGYVNVAGDAQSAFSGMIIRGSETTSNPYRILGLGLCLAGTIFAPVSYFIINSVPLTAVGISTIVIGFVCIALANTRPYVSPEASELMLKTGMENIAALLEELGIRSKAVYLPSTMRDGHPQALVPLVENRQIEAGQEQDSGTINSQIRVESR
jgi:hypothetical protein